jgi:subfamily B ATP-binding cassette protein MsbA
MALENVTFSYTGTENILEDINLSLHKGETLALIGESGSGKTTLMNILSGLLQPTEGRFIIDGMDSRELRMSEIQSRIGYITQEPVIFDDSVYNNVTFWAPRTPENEAQFWHALNEAQMRDFVDALPAGPDARLGNNGINISGGQKQRISIARELYKNVDFLFMDEATSALDSETEKAIQANIDALRGEYSILIIAHRLSTIKNADRVVVMKAGRIEQIGTYRELVESSVSFSKMVELQEV